MNKPLVSVSIITYNHHHFLREAIESVLEQKVDFPYEIIIGDDCSNDGTQEIIKDYEKKYPNKIFGIYHPRRYNEIPGRTNNMTNLYACRGKYIAMLDGDDKWLSKDKLQRQVDFLEANPDYSLSFHDALVVGENNNKPYLRSEKTFPFLNEKEDYTHEDVGYDWFMPTSSLVFRNIFAQQELPEWFRSVIRADYALLLMLSKLGKARFIKDLQCMRRINPGSFTKTVMQDLKVARQLIDELEFYGREFPVVSNHKNYEANQLWYRDQYLRQAILQKNFASLRDGYRLMLRYSVVLTAKFTLRFSYRRGKKILLNKLKKGLKVF